MVIFHKNKHGHSLAAQRIVSMMLLALLLLPFAACSDDDLGPSIFNTDRSIDNLDRTLATFPLDTFLKKEFLLPYNLRFVYRLEDKMTDMTKNLVPATYQQSVDLAVLTKYICYDVYKKYAGEEFLKKYSPHIIQLAGSKNYNPSTGTEVMGDASSGVKINFYNVNNLDITDPTSLNDYFFSTMHHEFAHILDQNHLHPTDFNAISQGHYDASGWQSRPDSMSAGSGFVSSYASSSYSEDWAETLANYITRDTLSWNTLLQTADYDWELYEIGNAAQYEDSLANYNNARPVTRYRWNAEKGQNDTITFFSSVKDSIYYNLRTHGVSVYDVMGYLEYSSSEQAQVYRKIISRDAQGLPLPNEKWQLQFTHTSGVDGRALILQKVEYVRQYLKNYYNVSLDDLRREVQSRTFLTNDDGTMQFDSKGNLINRLIQVQPSGKTLIDELRQQVYQYNSLIER